MAFRLSNSDWSFNSGFTYLRRSLVALLNKRMTPGSTQEPRRIHRYRGVEDDIKPPKGHTGPDYLPCVCAENWNLDSSPLYTFIRLRGLFLSTANVPPVCLLPLLRTPPLLQHRTSLHSSHGIGRRVTYNFAMRSQVQSPKKQRLTLAQLAAYDDILTDALVDHVSLFSDLL